MKCRGCGLDHPGTQHCTVARRLAESAGTAAPTPKIKTIVGDPSEMKKAVTVTKQTKKATVTVTPTVTVTNRMTALRARKAADGLVALTVWAHPDNHKAIKDFASGL